MRSLFFLSIIVFLSSCDNSGNEIDNEDATSTSEDTTVTYSKDLTSSNKTVEYHPNGNIKMEGNLNDDGQRQGLWIAYYENGTKWSESYYVDGIRDGHSLSFYPNGRIRYVGEYKNDVKVGEWKFYNEDGSLATVETY